MSRNTPDNKNDAYSNNTGKTYEERTAVGKVVQDLGGVAGLLSLGAGVANTIQQNRQNRNNQQQYQDQSTMSFSVGETPPQSAPPLNDETRRKQNNLIIGLVSGAILLIVVIVILNKKGKTVSVATNA